MSLHSRKCLIILAVTFSLLILWTVQVYAAPPSEQDGLLYYTEQAEFEKDFPGLPVEDFEESSITPGQLAACAGPLDSTTFQPPNCFSPGDIVSGLSLDGDPSHTPNVMGSGYSTATTSSVSLAAPLGDVLHISFAAGDVHAVAMDLATFSSFKYTIDVYGPGNIHLGTITTADVLTAESFNGIFSPRPITRITLDNGDYEIVDNIRFGTMHSSSVTFYLDQSVFEAAHPGLPIEDFEESPVALAGIESLPEPLDSTTNVPGVFVPDDIIKGLRIETILASGPLPLAVIGDFYAALSMSNSSKMVCSMNPADDMEITFSGYNAYAAGMDLLPAPPPRISSKLCLYNCLQYFWESPWDDYCLPFSGPGNFFWCSLKQVDWLDYY